MVEETKTINRFNLFEYPNIEDGYHYRGQVPKYNNVKQTSSQLCRFVSSDVDNLSRSEKYKDLYSIIICNDEKVVVKCMVCQEDKVLSFKGDSVDNTSGQRIIEFKNFWSHAFNFHLSEFTMSDIKKHKTTKEFEKKEQVKVINKNSIKSAFENVNNIVNNSQASNNLTNKAITTDIANLIIYGNFPFRLIESFPLREAIRSILARCNARIISIKFQSRGTVTRRVKEIVEKHNSEYCEMFLSIVKNESQFDSPFFALTNDSSTSVASIHYSVLTGSKIKTTSDGSSWSLKEYYLNCSATSALKLKADDNYNQMNKEVMKLLVNGKIHPVDKPFNLSKYVSAGYLF